MCGRGRGEAKAWEQLRFEASERENTWADLQAGKSDFPFSMITNAVKHSF